jgi:hypothetical protein
MPFVAVLSILFVMLSGSSRAQQASAIEGVFTPMTLHLPMIR